MTPSEIIAEFRKKYEGTYLHVQMPDSKENNLFYLQEVSQIRGSDTAVLKLTSEEFGKIQLNMGTAHTLKFAFPEVGVFQHGADAYLFRRTPRRQWRRGLCGDNAEIVPIDCRFTGTGRGGMSFALVESAYCGKYYSYKEALAMLKTGKYRSVAMTNGFVVMLSPIKSGEFLLLYRTSAIARLKDTGELVSIVEPYFEAQIKKVIQ